MSDYCEDCAMYYECDSTNCADVAYQQGRADAIAEISREMRMLYGNEYEKKIRTDAIDELSNLIDILLWEYDIETYKDLSESFRVTARLLEEQKNGQM